MSSAIDGAAISAEHMSEYAQDTRSFLEVIARYAPGLPQTHHLRRRLGWLVIVRAPRGLDLLGSDLALAAAHLADRIVGDGGQFWVGIAAGEVMHEHQTLGGFDL